jgi:hypothetical protein
MAAAASSEETTMHEPSILEDGWRDSNDVPPSNRANNTTMHDRTKEYSAT